MSARARPTEAAAESHVATALVGPKTKDRRPWHPRNIVDAEQPPLRCHRPARPDDPVSRDAGVPAERPLEYWMPACAGMTSQNHEAAFSRRVSPELCVKP